METLAHVYQAEDGMIRKNWKAEIAFFRRTATALEKEIVYVSNILPPEAVARFWKIQMRLLDRADRIEETTTQND